MSKIYKRKCKGCKKYYEGFGKFCCSFNCLLKWKNKRKKIAVICKLCKKEFHTYNCWAKKGGGKYCSSVCYHKSRLKNLDKGPQFISRNTIHRWAKKHIPKPKLCVFCKINPSCDMANLNHKYHKKILDWKWLCRSCHVKYDYKIGKRSRNKNVKVQTS